MLHRGDAAAGALVAGHGLRYKGLMAEVAPRVKDHAPELWRCTCQPLPAHTRCEAQEPTRDCRNVVTFHLDCQSAAGAVRCALLEPELKTFGLSTWHPGCGYGCALAASTLRLQPNEVLDFAQSLALELSGAAAESAPPAVVAWRDFARQGAGADDPRVAGEVVALPRRL